MQTRPGELGQYDVLVDGAVVATRQRGLARILGGGWPTADEVVRAIEQREGSDRP